MEMGAPFRLTFYAPDEAAATASRDAALARIRSLNQTFSDYLPDSELSRLPLSAPPGQPVALSPDLWEILSLSHDLAQRSGGAFDITVGPLTRLWRETRREGKSFDPAATAAMRESFGHQHLRLDAAGHTATLLRPGMSLDLGGIAKGRAADAALAVLLARGHTAALVAAAGDIAAGDPPPGLPGWRILISPLDAPGAPPPREVWLRHSAVSTSGDAVQHLDAGGVRQSHIIDPRTGVPLTDHSLVTVLGPDATTTDSLATTLSVLGPEAGLQFLATVPHTAALICRQPGPGPVEVHQSPGWDTLASLPPHIGGTAIEKKAHPSIPWRPLVGAALLALLLLAGLHRIKSQKPPL